MHRLTTLKSQAALLFLFFFSIPALAQTPAPESNDVFEVRSHLVLASDRPGDAAATRPLPQSLSALTAAIKRDHGFQSFSLLEATTGRVASGGFLDSRGMTDVRYGTVTGFPSYSEFRATGIRPAAADMPSRIKIETVRSGLRIPVRSTANPEGGPGVNYESVFYSNQRVVLADGVSTLVGSFSLPNAAGTVFIVLTVSRISN